MRIIGYIVLVLLSLVGASFLWGSFAVDRLFHCSDSCGPIDFIPPFVHNAAGDHYIAPAWIVWVLWAAVLVVVFAWPAFAVRPPFRTEGHPQAKQQTS